MKSRKSLYFMKMVRATRRAGRWVGAATGCDPESTDDFTRAGMPGGEKSRPRANPYGTGIAF